MRRLDIDLTDYQAGDFMWYGFDTDQVLGSPPNVKGWQGYHSWLNSATLPKRNIDFARELIINKAIPGRLINPHNGFTYDPIPFTDDAVIQWAKQFPDYNGELNLFATQIATFLCAIIPDDASILHIVSSSGILHTYEWASLSDSLKVQPIRQMLFTAIQLPHFQLC